MKGKSEGRAVNLAAKVAEFTLGSIVVEGEEYCRHILIFADVTVKTRKTGLREKM